MPRHSRRRGQRRSFKPPTVLLSTHSTRAFDIPACWVDEAKLRVVREQWGRKVGSAASTQTDGRWVVLAPAVQGEVRPPGGFTPVSLPLQLYRLSSPATPRWRWGGTEAHFCAESARADGASECVNVRRWSMREPWR